VDLTSILISVRIESEDEAREAALAMEERADDI
jgi:hypothetical protein